MVTATAFASLLLLPALVFFACCVAAFVYRSPVIAEDPMAAPTIDGDAIERLQRAAWKAQAGLLVEGIRPDIAAKTDAILRRADTCQAVAVFRQDPATATLASALYRQAVATVAAAYRHPSPRSILHSYGY